MSELKGYEYIVDASGETKAVQRSTGEITETVWMCVPIGSQIWTPDEIVAQAEYLKLKEQNELRRLSNKDLGKFFFISNDEDFKDLLPQTVTRLIYLNTYTHFGDNKLMLTERTPIKRKDLDKIQFLSLAEFCNIIGYNISQLNRLLNIYKNITFDVKGKQKIFCAFAYSGLDRKTSRIFVNPHILYNGTNYNKVKVLGAFCKE